MVKLGVKGGGGSGGSGTGVVETVVAGTGISVDSTDPANPIVSNTYDERLLDPVDDWRDPTSGLPVAPADGDRYIATETANGWTTDYIYTRDATSGTWLETPPVLFMVFWMIAEFMWYVFDTGGWMAQDHNALCGLQGGTADEYYHLTAAQLAIVNATSNTNTGDQTITNSSDSTSHTITLSASGGTTQFIEGTGITLTTGGTGSAGTLTIASTGGAVDQSLAMIAM